MLLADVPILFHGNGHHLMHLGIASIALTVHSMHSFKYSRSRAVAPSGLRTITCNACSTSPMRRRATPAVIDFLESKKRYTFAGLMRSVLAISATVVF